MRMRGDGAADRALVLGVMAAYAAGALIIASVLLSTALWPAVSSAF